MTLVALVSALGVLGALGARELLENAAWVAELLVRRALRRIPEKDREVVAAEWLAELDYIRERRSKLATLVWGVFVYLRSGRHGRILSGGEESPSLLATHHPSAKVPTSSTPRLKRLHLQ